MKALLFCPADVSQEIKDGLENFQFISVADDTELKEAIELGEYEVCDYLIIHDDRISEKSLFDALDYYPLAEREMKIIFIASPYREKPSAFYDQLIFKFKVNQIIAPNPEDDLDWILDLAQAIHRPIPEKQCLRLSLAFITRLKQEIRAKEAKANETKDEPVKAINDQPKTQQKQIEPDIEEAEHKQVSQEKTETPKPQKVEEIKQTPEPVVEQAPVVAEEKTEPINKVEAPVIVEPQKVEEQPKKEEAPQVQASPAPAIETSVEASIYTEPVAVPQRPVIKQQKPMPPAFLAYGGTRYIAIAQIRPREGSTHIALSLARAISLAKQKVALVIPTSTYGELRRAYGKSDRFSINEDAQMINFLGIDFYRNTDGYGSLQAENYDFVIADLGLAEFYYEKKSPRLTEKEFTSLVKVWNRADVKIISSFITPVGHWYVGSDFLNSGAINKKDVASIKWAVFGINHPQVGNAVNAHLKKHMPSNSRAKAVEIPYIPQPLFMLEENVPEQLYELIESVVDRRTKEFSGQFAAVKAEEEQIEELREAVEVEEPQKQKGLFGKFFGGKR